MISDDEEERFSCRICDKRFFTHVALDNHAKVEHFDVFSIGDPVVWTSIITDNLKPKKNKYDNPVCSVDSQSMQQAEKAVLSSMTPGALTTFADADVNLIIFKLDDDHTGPVKKKKKKKKSNKGEGSILEDHDYQIASSENLKSGTQLNCKQCDITFETKALLNAHVKSHHSKLSDVICEVCGKILQSNKALRKHSVEHKEEYACPECTEKFSTYYKLKKHYLDHSLGRRFCCDLCKERLPSKMDLDVHYYSVHRLTKPHECELCGSTFNQKHSLKIHMNAVHKESTTYTCKFCSNTFNNTDSLALHENTIHRKLLAKKKKRNRKEYE